MKLYSILLLLALTIFISSCSGNISSQQIGCDPTEDQFYLVENIGYTIDSDSDALEAFKEYSCSYDDEGGSFGMTDCIRNNMAVDESIGSIIRKYDSITLKDGSLIDSVWVLWSNQAFDKEGNFYYCEHISINDGPGQFCDETGCSPLPEGKQPE